MKINDMRVYELEVLADNNKVKKLFDLDNILLEEYINARTGKHVKKYSLVQVNDTYYKINKPYSELSTLIINRSIPILGLMYKSKRYK